MSLPAAWVDSLFTRLSVRYGQAFIRQYGDMDTQAVKADWGAVLSGFGTRPEAIAYGLDNLPADKPPTALQFRDACRRAPEPATPRLHAPAADPQRVAAALDCMNATRHGIQNHRAWAHALKAREQAGERLTKAERDMWRGALGEG